MDSYEKKYKEALERAKEIKSKLLSSHLSTESCKAVSEYIDTIIPELAESEEERIRKLLIWQVHRNIEDETNDLAQSVYDGIKGHDPDLEESIEDWKKCLAWLEKQKEPHYTKRNELFDKCVENCDSKVMKEVSDKVDEMLQKERGPLTKEEERTLQDIILHLEDEGCPTKWKDLLHDIYNLPYTKQKEQEHPDGCFTCDEYKKGYEAGRLNGLTAGYNKAKKEQKPAEWSEEDELMILTVIQTLETLGGRGTTGMQIDWLKSLRPQPHWKPSEEQMKALIDCTIGNEYDVHTLVRLWAELKKL